MTRKSNTNAAVLISVCMSVPVGADHRTNPQEFLIATDLTAAGSTEGSPGRPGIAFDGEKFLIVTCRDTDSPAQLIGAFVSTEGTLISEFPIVDYIHFNDCDEQPSPSVAFDGNQFLLAFDGGGTIWATRVTTSGIALDGPEGFAVSEGSSNFSASVAFDGLDFFIAWNRFQGNYDVHGARVSAAGVVSHRGPLLTAPGEQVSASAACGSENCLVVWRDTRPGAGPNARSDILGLRVNSLGDVLDATEIQISTAPAYQGSPDVTFFARNYLVTWTDARADPDGITRTTDIYATRVSPDGVVLDGPPDTGGIAINTAPAPRFSKGYSRVANDGVDYFVSWEKRGFDASSGVFAARVSSDGELVDLPAASNGIRIATPSCFACRPVLAELGFDGTKVFTGWLNNRELNGETKELQGVFNCRVDLSGQKAMFRHRCRPLGTVGGELTCTVRAKLRTFNRGYHRSLERASVDLVLSDNPWLDAGDTVVRREPLTRLRPRATIRSRPFKLRTTATPASGKYVLAVLNPPKPELDCNPADNVVVLGRVQTRIFPRALRTLRRSIEPPSRGSTRNPPRR